MVRVLGILGSPREGGNTEVLLDAALSGAKAAGAQVEKIRVGDLSFSGCIECNDCLETGECTIVDDMAVVYEALERADRIIIASPIFFMGLPSQLKAIIDRCQQYWALKYVLREDFPRPAGAPKRYGVFIGVGATRGDRLFDGTILTLKYFFDAINAEPLTDSYLLVKGIDEKGEISGRPEAIEAARDLGRSLVSLGG
ncbi:MAG: flavodoxin family protein [Gaiellales bacterium]|nr:MAG: flavodoxin family protein [Gaiellales bacterium]